MSRIEPYSFTTLRRGVAAAAVLLVTMAARSPAQEADRLSLGETYREVRRASPRATAARALARAGEARVSAAKVPPDPQLTLAFMNYALPGLRPMDPLGMAQVELMQMVPIAGKLALSERIASAQARAQAARAGEVEWEVRSEAAMAFYDLYAADEGLAVARETLRLLQDARRVAEAMYRVGEGRQADVLRAQVEVAKLVEDTIRMTSMRAAMAARFNVLLDRPASTQVASPVLPAFPDAVPPMDGLIARADQGRPILEAGELELEAATSQTTLARRQIWPDLTVGLQYAQRASDMGIERMGSFMIGASIPIFARSRQLRMREEAAAMQQMAAAELAAMKADTRGRVAVAYASLVRARNLASLYRTTVLPQAEAAVTSALAAYRVGGVDFMTVAENQMTVNGYRQALFALEAEQGKAWADLEMLVGRELFDPDVMVAGAAAAPARR